MYHVPVTTHREKVVITKEAVEEGAPEQFNKSASQKHNYSSPLRDWQDSVSKRIESQQKADTAPAFCWYLEYMTQILPDENTKIETTLSCCVGGGAWYFFRHDAAV